MIIKIIFWVLFGSLVGWLAGMVSKKGNAGFWMNAILGVVGSIVGGMIFEFFGGGSVTGFNLYSILVGVVGSVVVLFIRDMFVKKINFDNKNLAARP